MSKISFLFELWCRWLACYFYFRSALEKLISVFYCFTFLFIHSRWPMLIVFLDKSPSQPQQKLITSAKLIDSFSSQPQQSWLIVPQQSWLIVQSLLMAPQQKWLIVFPLQQKLTVWYRTYRRLSTNTWSTIWCEPIVVADWLTLTR